MIPTDIDAVPALFADGLEWDAEAPGEHAGVRVRADDSVTNGWIGPRSGVEGEAHSCTATRRISDRVGRERYIPLVLRDLEDGAAPSKFPDDGPWAYLPGAAISVAAEHLSSDVG